VATHTQIETELSRLFPEGAIPTERLPLTELRTGATGRLMLLSLEGTDTDLVAEASKQLAAWIRPSGAFHYVGNWRASLDKGGAGTPLSISIRTQPQASMSPPSPEIIFVILLSCG
jgi:predicted exporter